MGDAMNADERRRIDQWMRRVNHQRRTVVEHLHSRSRQLDAFQRLLHRQLEAAGLEAVEVTLHDRIDPLNGGPSLNSDDPEQQAAFHEIDAADLPPDTAQKDWWPSIDDPNGPLKPSPGWQNIKLLDKAVRTVGVLLLGQPPAVIDRVVATFLRQQTQRLDFAPVFIVDSTYADPFLQYGFVAELIPPQADQANYAGTRPWDAYVMDRLRGIRDKWMVAQFVEFGTPRYKIPGLFEDDPEAEPSAAEDDSLNGDSHAASHLTD